MSQPAVEPQATPEGEGRPEWLPDNFNSPEDLAKSYRESQASMNRMQAQMEAERNQFAAALETLEAERARPAQQQNGQEFDPLTVAYQRAYEDGDTAQMLRISAEAAARNTTESVGKLLDERLGALQPVVEDNQRAQRTAIIARAEEIVARRIGPQKYEELLPVMTEMLSQRPHYLPQTADIDGYVEAIIDITKIAEYESLAQNVESLQAERAEKLAAQTLPGAGRASVYTPDEQKAEFDRIKGTKTGSYSELMSGS